MLQWVLGGGLVAAGGWQWLKQHTPTGRTREKFRQLLNQDVRQGSPKYPANWLETLPQVYLRGVPLEITNQALGLRAYPLAANFMATRLYAPAAV